jgi:hypothetical protein
MEAYQVNKYRISILAGVVIALLCAGCQSREEAVSQSTIHQIQTPIATNISYQSEEAPDGVRFLNKADSLDALRRQAKADLTWTDPDGAPIFLWIKHNPDQSHWTFTLDEAHFVTQDRNTFWCFLDNSSGDGLAFQNPVNQFMLQKFVRAQIEFPFTDYHDGNESLDKLVSTNRNHGTIFEIVYCSNWGGNPLQGGTRTYLIYISADGKCNLVARDLGQNGTYSEGWFSEDNGFDFNVVWKPLRSAIPFNIKFRSWVDTEVSAEEGISYIPDFDYMTYQDGDLVGNEFPLMAKISAVHYVESDGKITLKSLADVLMFYYSDWINYDWIKPADQPRINAEVTKAWTSELQRLNPTIGLNQHIPKGQRIITIANEDEFNDSIYERVRNEINSDK